MGNVTESIFDAGGFVIPLADVQHIEKQNDRGGTAGFVITKHTRWDFEHDHWANPLWLSKDIMPRFLVAWCRYRHELEKDTLKDLMEEPCEPRKS